MLNLFRYTFLILLISFSAQVTAQIEKGTISILPDISLSYNKSGGNSDFSSTFFSLVLRPSLYVIDNLAVNADLGFNSFSDSNSSDFQTDVVLGGSLTYMIPISEKLYIPAFVGYGNTIRSGDDNNVSSFRFGAGIEYLVADRLGLRFSVQNSLITFNGGIDTRIYTLNGFFGVNVYFTKKSE